MNYFNPNIKERLADFYSKSRKITVLTGAGLSVDSGIPTFRGTDGYWTIGSENYKPEEIGTFKMFKEHPLEVWNWFYTRKTKWYEAVPNGGHHAIKELEDIFEDRFRLITQNVDGLHFKANSSLERASLIHGSLDWTRCGNSCNGELYPFPEFGGELITAFTDEQIEKLKCPNCGHFLRPHVLWFDEDYNEKDFKLESSLRIARETGLLLIVGTSGATNLPNRIVENVFSRQGVVIDINLHENHFSEMMKGKKNGYSITGPSSAVLPELVEFFKALQKVRS